MPTATASTRRGPRRGTLLAGAALVVAAAAIFALAYGRSPSTTAAPTPSDTSTVAITSDTRHQFGTLAELVDASDLVVRGRVVAAEAGRVFGTGGDDSAAIRSHVLSLRVGAVLAGAHPAGPNPMLLVEEEATLTDGTPVSVDGMRASRVGDDGIWFLVASGDPEFPGYAVVSAQGRYLNAPGGKLAGGDASDALVGELTQLGRTRLAEEVVGSSDR